MKKLKKTLCLFLVLVMCLGLVNIGALAATFEDLQNAIDGTNGTEIEEGSGRYGYAQNTDEDGNHVSWGIEAWNGEDGNRNVQLNEDVSGGDADPTNAAGTDDGITVGKDQNVTIDLNGNDIDGSNRTGDTITVENGGDLTLKNEVGAEAAKDADAAKAEADKAAAEAAKAEAEKKAAEEAAEKAEAEKKAAEEAVEKAENDEAKAEAEEAAKKAEEAAAKAEADKKAAEDAKTKADQKAEDAKSNAEERAQEAERAESKVVGSNDNNVVTVKGNGKNESTNSSLTLEDGVNITHNAGNQLTQNKDENGKTTAPTFTEGTGNSGRGVEVDGGKLTMNGGKITDNKVGGGIDEKADNYRSDKVMVDGKEVNKEAGIYQGKVGGGVWVHNGGSLEMKGGEISNNAAAEGGGVFVGKDVLANDDTTSSFQMKGGTVSNNVAKSGEGGGIYIRSGTTKTEDGKTVPANQITGGNITGNATFTTKDLGGGGIYVENNGKLTIRNLVLTGNLANGLGGGLAGCVHGKTMINIADGSIIYGNTANGEATTKGHTAFSPGADNTNGWNIDGHATINGQPVWNGQEDADWKGAAEDTKLKDYAQDVFSAGKDTADGGIYIPTEMLNGIKPGWTGFVYKDGAKEQIALDKNGQVVITGSNVMGLTSNLTADDLKLVQNFLAKVGSQNRVLVSGNYSNVHGGGIGNNGELTIGTKSDEVKGTGVVVEIPTHKNVGYKDQTNDLGTFGYVDANDKFTMNGGEFTFELVQADENGEYNADAEVVFDNSNNKDGNVAVRIPSTLLEGEGTYTFYLREQTGNVDGITYDGAVYKIVVEVTEGLDTSVGEDGKFTLGSNKITFKKLTAKTTVMKQNEDGEWKPINEEGSDKKNPAEFTNTYTQDTFAEVNVEKKWDDNDNPDRPTSVKVQLYYTVNDQKVPYGDVVTLTAGADGKWEHTWKELPLKDEAGNKIAWSVEEVDVPDGYSASHAQDGKLVTVTNTKNPENPGPGPGPGPDPDPEPTDIPDEEPPLVDIPDEETPTTDIPDEEPPLVEIPDEEPPLVDMPPETDIPDVDVPLADVPQTGDYSLVWCAVAVVSVLGLAVLTLKKREDEEA